jgi:glyoxylase-like metal-dependent hydrolase (beta-lactamase superfamily II)
MIPRPGVALVMLALFGCAGAPPAPSVSATRATAATGLPTAATSPAFAYTIEPLAPGVYAFIEPRPTSGLVSGNSLVVVGDDGVLVLDTSHFASLARKMIADIRRLTDKPVRYVVTSHWHADHIFGNAAFHEAFPGATFLAHAETRRLAIKNDPQYIDMQRNLATLLESYRRALATGKRRSGALLTAAERSQVEATIPVMLQTLGDTDVELFPPDATFDDAVTVYLGKREVRVMHLGRGNTTGDAMVYVPDAKVLATGDVLVAPAPYAFGSYLGDWVKVLGKIEGLEPRAIVPGHGPVEHDLAYVKSLEGLFTSVLDQARDAVKQGLSLEQTRGKVDVSSFRRALAGDDAAIAADFQAFFVEPAVERAYQEATGKLEDE